MSVEKKPLDLEGFSIPSFQDWKTAAEKLLKGVPFEKKLLTPTPEGFFLQPLYTAGDTQDIPHLGSYPGFEPYPRGASVEGAVLSPWVFSQVMDPATPEEATLQVKEVSSCHPLPVDLPLSTLSRFLEPISQALSPFSSHPFSWNVRQVSSLPSALKTLQQVFSGAGMDFSKAEGTLDTDPLHHVEELATTWSQVPPGWKTLLFSGQAWHWAGASISQGLAFTLSSAVETINELLDKGFSLESILPRVAFSFEMASHFLLEVAGIRAARMLWRNIVKAYSKDADARMWIHAQTSSFVQTRFDPYVNILRATTQAFSAVAAGVQALTIVPFDALSGKSTPLSRRVARNIHFILWQEVGASMPIDPAGGSYAMETLSQQLAQKSWELFVSIQEKGGMRALLQNGTVQQWCRQSLDGRNREIAKRKSTLVGTSHYVDPQDNGMDVAPGNVSAWLLGNGSLPNLVSQRLALPFEKIREQSARFAEKWGRRPRVLLLNMGPISQHKLRADFSRGFFTPGGFEVIGTSPLESVENALLEATQTPCEAMVICSTDDTYPGIVPDLVRGIREKGVDSLLLLAGRLSSEDDTRYREVGLDGNIFLGQDCPSTLRRVLHHAGFSMEGSEE
ncbi:MAG TPA: methylmalonyl-CoA mutase family protein [Thermotogota bacterium]|mgnify:CR=1 FL=1|nr:methylmalonyl-CoA mutase family protein [Thermotogota bacterium]HRW92380.1 methylmalonyl-CoA mutase family protein [Thermotogota bacterium]